MPCYDDAGKIDQALELISSAILQKLGSAAPAGLQGVIQNDIDFEMKQVIAWNSWNTVPDPDYYAGGHFNLYIYTADLTPFGSTFNTIFHNTFAGSGLSGRIAGGVRLPASGSTLHSQLLNDPNNPAYQFHLDAFNPMFGGSPFPNPIGAALHGVVDVLFGNFHYPCLDKPWN